MMTTVVVVVDEECKMDGGCPADDVRQGKCCETLRSNPR
jgi:hypothetical protein